MEIHFKQNLNTRTQPKVWEYVWNIIVTEGARHGANNYNFRSQMVVLNVVLTAWRYLDEILQPL